MYIYLMTEIKEENITIRELQDELVYTNDLFERAVFMNDLYYMSLYKERAEHITQSIIEHRIRLNDLKRELRYLDVNDDYYIHRESMDELSKISRKGRKSIVIRKF